MPSHSERVRRNYFDEPKRPNPENETAVVFLRGELVDIVEKMLAEANNRKTVFYDDRQWYLSIAAKAQQGIAEIDARGRLVRATRESA